MNILEPDICINISPPTICMNITATDMRMNITESTICVNISASHICRNISVYVYIYNYIYTYVYIKYLYICMHILFRARPGLASLSQVWLSRPPACPPVRRQCIINGRSTPKKYGRTAKPIQLPECTILNVLLELPHLEHLIKGWGI